MRNVILQCKGYLLQQIMMDSPQLQTEKYLSNDHRNQQQAAFFSSHEEESTITDLQNQTVAQFIKLNQNSNKEILRNNRIFGIILCVQQVVLCFMYGFLFTVPMRTQINAQKYQSMITGIFIYFLYASLLLVGFGLLFTYLKRMMWSSIGFTLLIGCLTIQWYFIFNNFVSKLGIDNSTRSFNLSSAFNYLYLWNGELNRSFQAGESQLEYVTYGATLSEALKCSISMVVGFSVIMGKIGLLQLYIVCLIGSFGYTLNMSVIHAVGIDFGSCHTIFTFGGFMGLIMGLILYLIRFRKYSPATNKHPLYTSNTNNSLLSLLGALIIFSLLPTLTIDPQYLHETLFQQQYLRNQIVYSSISVLYSASAAITIVIGLSIFFNDKLCIRGLINSIIGGGIASLSSVFFLSRPWPALLIGIISGILQFVVHNLFGKTRNNMIVSNSFIVFGGQGLLSCCAEAIIQAALNPQDPKLQNSNIVVGLISAGIGSIFGLIIGLIISIFSKHTKNDHFTDQSYWVDFNDEHFCEQSQREILKAAWHKYMLKYRAISY